MVGTRRAGGAFRRHSTFRLYSSPSTPTWRIPQLGALGATLAHWSVRPEIPALIAIPTGVGKTALALSYPYLMAAKRVLVVVPSIELREQTVAAFSTQAVLKAIGALGSSPSPRVLELKGRVADWTTVEPFDVVVTHPNSVSPSHYQTNAPPRDLFDLVIIDEAHHAPAKTWQAIIDHFEDARRVLLTATPRRQDEHILPGELVYHYPLRRALNEGIFKPIQPSFVQVPSPVSRDVIDDLIAQRATSVLGDPAHASSSAIVRAGSVARARELADRYSRLGTNAAVLHSKLTASVRAQVVADLRAGAIRCVVVVGMLTEGFDLPSLRVLAYHDKYKSLPATAQLFGRLARVDARYPQPSVLVTALDADVYPELKGMLRDLYREEDEDWAKILPGVLDDEIAADRADRQFVAAFPPTPPSISLAAVTPLRRVVAFESKSDLTWAPDYAVSGDVPAALEVGRAIRGAIIVYAAASPDRSHLLIVTQESVRPRWHNHAGLDTLRYDLSIVSFQRSRVATQPPLLLVNSDNGAMVRALATTIDPAGVLVPGNPTRMGEFLDSLDRESVSSVGVRNTAAGPGIPSYQTFAGKGVDHGIRESDVPSGALGHAIVQLSAGTAAGISARKAKYWETKYTPLRLYSEFVQAFAARYWVPPESIAGQLLPILSRPAELSAWSPEPTIAVDLDYALLDSDLMIDGTLPVSRISLESITVAGVPDGCVDRRHEGFLPLLLTLDDGSTVRMEQGLDGSFSPIGREPMVMRGYATPQPLSELLEDFPPTVFFLDGTTVRGRLVYEGRPRQTRLPPLDYRPLTWTGTDIEAETDRTARAHRRGISVQAFMFDYLHRRPANGRHRWVLHNDGGGEFADCLLLEYDRDRGAHLELWHVKPSSSPAPSVRVTDMQEAVAQAIKGRHWLKDRGLWEEMAERLAGRRQPRLRVIHGSERALRALCGDTRHWRRGSLRARAPIVDAVMGIAQPGFSAGALRAALVATPNEQEGQVRDLLAVLHDSVSRSGAIAIACSA
jgi:superfamily II DNA or RNA helicase